MIYDSFFGFTSEPFGVTPDPGIFFLSRSHEEALAHLKFGINEERGFIMLTGEVGSGKTTLMRHLINSLDDKTHTSVILNPEAGPYDLLSMITSDFGIDCREDNQAGLMKCLNGFLLSAFTKREKALIFIDEAQDMSRESLEFVRLLSNLETDTKKLLQIVLLGQPELADKVGDRSMRQLDQRIAVRYHIGPLRKDELSGYIDHRLGAAGSPMIFPDSTVNRICRYSKGIPRLVNRACDRILLNAYAEGSRTISKSIADKAFSELGERKAWSIPSITRPVAAALLVITGIAAVAVFLPAGAILDRLKHVSGPGLSIDRDGMVRTADAESARTASVLSLIKMWGETDIPLSATSAEKLVREKGYEAYSAGSWKMLRTLNFPALLRLNDGRHVVLVWIIGDDAVVFDPLTGRSIMPVSDLARDSSEIVILWRNKYNRADRTGLMQSRLSDMGMLADHTAGVIDSKTTAALRKFQRSAGIKVSGRPDEETMILLSRDSSSPELYPQEIRHRNIQAAR